MQSTHNALIILFRRLELVERYQFPSNFSQCVVRKLKCGDNYNLLESASSATCSSLTCDDILQNQSSVVFVNRTNDSCIISSNSSLCFEASNCFDWIRICDNSTSCEWRGLSCTNKCIIPASKIFCNCLLDFVGSECENPREFKCTFVLESPIPNCESLNPQLNQNQVDADPVCHRYRFADQIAEKFQYRLNCSFVDIPPVSNNDNNDDAFQYAVRLNSTFAVSLISFTVNSWQGAFKVFNWKVLSDSSQTILVNLSPTQLAGVDLIEFPIDFATLTNENLFGGRMYAEVGFNSLVAPPGLSRTFWKDRLFVDFVDLADLSNYPPEGIKPSNAERRASNVDEREGESRNFFAILMVSMVAGLVVLVVIMQSFEKRTKRD